MAMPIYHFGVGAAAATGQLLTIEGCINNSNTLGWGIDRRGVSMGKNVVLLADGTGNSAASAFKTNVWRIYQALDTTPDRTGLPQQIAQYSDGVGTQSLMPLAIIDRMTGLGVWQQVMNLYLFACRNYVDGDRLYCFGFSRGAFAIRLLTDLISRFGIIKTDIPSESNLIQAVRTIYEVHRREQLIRGSAQRHMIFHHILRVPRYLSDTSGKATLSLPATGRQVFIDVDFVGLWDTVDAYGLPIESLKAAIDDWVWPLSIADRELPQCVRIARHALSLDDARPTFRPILWNEVIDNPESSTEKTILPLERIQQVWFSGSHANVGGGYPDDNLAYVPLEWMMDEALKAKLRFVETDRQDIRRRADAHGVYYDSRTGFAASYRYWPRNVRELCNDNKHQVYVPAVSVYRSVFDRIARHQVAYEPISLNCSFQVVGKNSPEHRISKIIAPDQKVLDTAWDFVWLRSIGYYVTMMLIAFLSLFAIRFYFAWPEGVLQAAEAPLAKMWASIIWLLGTTVTGAIFHGWGWLLDHINAVLPAWASLTVPSFREYPLSGILAVIIILNLHFVWMPALRSRSAQHAECAWAAQKGLDPGKVALPSTVLTRLARAWRKLRPLTDFFYRRLWRGVLVPMLGIEIGLAALVLLSPIWIWRMIRRRPWMA